jgi:hypothetical protein
MRCLCVSVLECFPTTGDAPTMQRKRSTTRYVRELEGVVAHRPGTFGVLCHSFGYSHPCVQMLHASIQPLMLVTVDVGTESVSEIVANAALSKLLPGLVVGHTLYVLCATIVSFLLSCFGGSSLRRGVHTYVHCANTIDVSVCVSALRPLTFWVRCQPRHCALSMSRLVCLLVLLQV